MSTSTGLYKGRFAPSPTGLLHFGSLCCALASYLDAKQHHGQWLVRIEDIDPPREQAGASAAILKALTLHGLLPDEPVVYQSQRSLLYLKYLDYLADNQLTYSCNCSRSRLASLGQGYDGHCLLHPPAPPYALRLKTLALPPVFSRVDTTVEFHDRHFGLQYENLKDSGDFIIHRKDGLFAYQLAVVVDDIEQGITHVVRGQDLLETTAKQIYLFHLLGRNPPVYGHIPLVVNPAGQKLSKQNLAQPLCLSTPGLNLWHALETLGARPPLRLQQSPPQAVLDWGLGDWRMALLPKTSSVLMPSI